MLSDPYIIVIFCVESMDSIMNSTSRSETIDLRSLNQIPFCYVQIFFLTLLTIVYTLILSAIL